jgi:hypothetical protein
MFRLTLLLIVLMVLWVPDGHAQSCSEADIRAAGAPVKTARALLHSHRLESYNTLVTPEDSLRIEAVKNRIEDFVATTVNCFANTESATQLEQRLNRLGDAEQPMQPPTGDAAKGIDPDDREYLWHHGNTLGYRAWTPAGHSNLLFIITWLGISCGEDDQFFAYEHDGVGWRRILERRSPPYREISGAWSEADAAVAGGPRLLIAFAHFRPWCTSVFRSIQYELLGRSAVTAPIKMLKTGYFSATLEDPPFEFVPTQDGVQLISRGGSLDADLSRYREIHAWRLTDDNAVQRVQPVATRPEWFVDAWFVAPWEEARRWSDDPPSARREQRRLRRLWGKHEVSFAGVKDCDEHTVEVRLDIERARPSLLLLVREGESFRLARVEEAPDPDCKGEVHEAIGAPD